MNLLELECEEKPVLSLKGLCVLGDSLAQHQYIFPLSDAGIMKDYVYAIHDLAFLFLFFYLFLQQLP